MATGFTPRIIALPAALLLAAACGVAAAAEVALIGIIGDKAAVLALDGGEPKTVKVGQTWNGISVLAVEGGRATVEIEGRTRVLALGQHYRRSAPPPGGSRQSAVLAADGSGHFTSDGTINGNPIRFLVDTGATMIALPARDATRMGIDYRKGIPGVVKTASGLAPVYRIVLDSVRVGDIELHGVDGIVLEQGLDMALLGMTFLNRVEMKREGDMMTLIRRF